MNKEWLELEEYIKFKISNEDPFTKIGLFFVKHEMERIKSEFYYQSLKEAGYF